MWNRNVLIVGQPGSGKTQLATRLAALAPRCIIFDPVTDYAPGDDGVIVWDGESALHALAERWDEPFRLIVRAESEAEAAAVVALAERVQREPGAGPITLVLEEAAIYGGTTFTVPDEIARVYRLGRRWRINSIAVTQIDTDLHRIFRANTHVWVALRSNKLSTDMQRMFSAQDVAQLAPILGPSCVPEPGVHYLTTPPETDLFAEFARANLWT